MALTLRSLKWIAFHWAIYIYIWWDREKRTQIHSQKISLVFCVQLNFCCNLSMRLSFSFPRCSYSVFVSLMNACMHELVSTIFLLLLSSFQERPSIRFAVACNANDLQADNITHCYYISFLKAHSSVTLILKLNDLCGHSHSSIGHSFILYNVE